MALPRDVQLRPNFAFGYGDVGQLERPVERPVGAVGETGAGEVEAMVEGALVADAERVRDVDVAAPRLATRTGGTWSSAASAAAPASTQTTAGRRQTRRRWMVKRSLGCFISWSSSILRGSYYALSMLVTAINNR
jgi:hypothetical protein